MDKPVDAVEFETMLLGRHSLFAGRAEGSQLDRSAYVVLSRIRVEGPMSIRQLSEAFDLDQSTLNRQTSAMLRAGLVERIPDPEGGIARKFRISGEGKRRLDRERRRRIGGLEKVLADWAPDAVAAFAAYLERFNIDVERRSERRWPRS